MENLVVGWWKVCTTQSFLLNDIIILSTQGCVCSSSGNCSSSYLITFSSSDFSISFWEKLNRRLATSYFFLFFKLVCFSQLIKDFTTPTCIDHEDLILESWWFFQLISFDFEWSEILQFWALNIHHLKNYSSPFHLLSEFYLECFPLSPGELHDSCSFLLRSSLCFEFSPTWFITMGFLHIFRV